MKIVILFFTLVCASYMHAAYAQTVNAFTPSFSGQTFTFAADIAARSPGDIQATTGYTRVRTDGNTLFFESALNNAQGITAVHIHLSPGSGAVDGGPLVLALTNTSSNPLSSNGAAPLVQTGSRSTADLLANAMLPTARQVLANNQKITDNALQNIGDVDRLLRLGVLYSDVHSTTRAPPNRVGSGLLLLAPANIGKRLS